MFYLIVVAVLYLAGAITALVIAILVLNIGFARVFFRQWPREPSVRYWAYVKRSVSHRSAAVVLIWIPAGVIGLFILLTLMIGPLRTSRLRSSLQDSTNLRIRTGGHCHRNPARERVLFETQQTSETESLLKSIAFTLTFPGRHCMCCGSISFEFYQGDKLVKSFSLHHGERIRIQYSAYGDIELTQSSRQRLAKWLEDREIEERLRQFNKVLRKQ